LDFLKKVSLVFVYKYIGLPIELFTSVIIVRYLGADHYGVYVTIYLLPMLIGSLGSLGFGPSIVYHINKNELYTSKYLFTFTLLGLCLGLLYFLILLSTFDVINDSFYEGDINKKFFIIASLFVPIMIVQKYLRAILRGLYNIKVFSLLLDIVAPVMRIFLVVIITFQDYGLFGIIYLPVLVQGGITLYLFIYLLSKYQFTFSIIEVHRLNQIFHFALKNYIGTALQKSSSSLILLIASTLLSFKDVGMISLAQKLIQAVTAISSAVSTVLMPKISRSSIDEIKLFITRLTSVLFAINILIFIIYLGLLEFIVVYLYGSEYLEIYPLSVPLCFSAIFLIFANLFLMVITFTGDPIKKAYARGFGLIINLVSCYPLFLSYGALGFAISIAIGQFFVFILSMYFFLGKFKDISLVQIFLINLKDIKYMLKLLKKMIKIKKLNI
jgi:O-antigen/teichoic acid export membrane protein